MERAKVVAAIKQELERQNAKGGIEAPYLHADEGESISIDGRVDLGELADAMIKLFDVHIDRLLAGHID